MTENSQDERRNFFRIEDEICLQYELLSEADYAHAAQELFQAEGSILNVCRNYAWLSYEATQLIHTIKPATAEIAAYLEILNKKIDLLAQQIFETTAHYGSGEHIMTSISASGIAFECITPLPVDQPIRLRMLLLPEKIHILALGRVKHIDQSTTESKACRVNIEFEHIHPIDQELMIRHNLNKQKQLLRSRK